MPLKIDTTTLQPLGQILEPCEVISIPAGAAPKAIIVQMPGSDGARVHARWQGSPALTVGDFVAIQRRQMGALQYVIVGASGGTASIYSAASETVAGIAELATQTETNTGTDDARIVTPLKLNAASTVVHPARTISTTAPLTGGGDLSANRTLAVSAASESAPGVAELATQTETDTGTDDLRIVTPLKLKSTPLDHFKVSKIWEDDGTNVALFSDDIGNVSIPGTLALAGGFAVVDEFSTDGIMAGNSDTAVPTEKAVVTYVAAHGGDPAAATHAAASKTTPVDADEIPLADSAASFALKKLTWANLKATLLTWLGTLLNATKTSYLYAANGTTVRVNANGSAVEVGASGSNTLLHTYGYMKLENDTARFFVENPTFSNADAARHCDITFSGWKADGTAHDTVQLLAEHDGAGNDLKGRLIIKVNDGSTKVEQIRVANDRITIRSGLVTTADIDLFTNSKLYASDGSPAGAIAADASGYLSAGVQPLFSAYNSATDSNVTGDATTYTIICDTEIVDRNSNYNNGTGVFTAPVTGKYLFTFSVSFEQIGASHAITAIRIITSNRTYTSSYSNTVPIVSSGFITIPGSLIADMDANDTATLSVLVSGGTKVVDVYGEAAPYTFLMGYLLP